MIIRVFPRLLSSPTLSLFFTIGSRSLSHGVSEGHCHQNTVPSSLSNSLLHLLFSFFGGHTRRDEAYCGGCEMWNLCGISKSFARGTHAIKNTVKGPLRNGFYQIHFTSEFPLCNASVAELRWLWTELFQPKRAIRGQRLIGYNKSGMSFFGGGVAPEVISIFFRSGGTFIRKVKWQHSFCVLNLTFAIFLSDGSQYLCSFDGISSNTSFWEQDYKMSGFPSRRPFAQLNKDSIQDKLRIKTVEANRRYRVSCGFLWSDVICSCM